MDSDQALSAFAALSQSTRLDVFRLLVAHEPEGLAAGEVARRLDVPHNTLSSHLGILARAGLIVAERQSRLIIYRARLEAVRHLASFILKDCCGGKPEICAPLIADLQPCCPAGVHPAEANAAKEARHV
ncbi:helix-turn-helix transcriptional regulator [Ancylobacter dichloromethanicus]|uniref:Transcriptional regulator n=1 Tax=Ancylobacter dichloromethanicus TaxID=518825 RepID=A0A9W6N0W0_9HYPH|nr:metalloregulator ArsR/SmtB family transcription factor [Ancylobacter dichloromethanicus]MBS7556644.1 helix-turn-helix transcriptional regulator [Ancylobacter dichloromethanicus]GLK73495.1 transcriptional regulator [Ancylobacter dichloromethanicus]